MGNLELILDIWLARVSAVLALMLSIVYVLRILNCKVLKNKISWIKHIDRFLRVHHKTLGILVIILGLIHGLYSSDSIASINLGTACWVFSILLGLNWFLRGKLQLKKSWIYYHRLLTLVFLGLLFIHIADVRFGLNLFKNEKQISENVDKPISEVTVDTWEHSNSDMSDIPTEDAPLKDGIYYGESTGYKPGLKVKVTVEKGTICEITVVENNETPKFLDMVVPSLLDKVVEEQSTDIDAVSGATKSSLGILDAVNDAISI
jgi:uncharacterized protein with FMN-binding domain